MIEEVVNSILEAEDAAKKRIAEAERKAGEIVASAELEAELRKKQAVAANKKAYAQAMKQADEQADAQAAARLAELNSASDKEIAAYAKNVDKAVKIIMEQSL